MLRKSVLAVVALAALVPVVALAAGLSGGGMGPSSSIKRPAFQGYYDDHKVTYLNTDVSDKAQAKSFHINYVPRLRAAMKASSEMYIFEGTAAAGQLVVFTSQPGEPSYSPLWHETFVHWKTGVTPTLVTSDTKIDGLIKSGMIVERESGIVLNCPIVKVGGGTSGGGGYGP